MPGRTALALSLCFRPLKEPSLWSVEIFIARINMHERRPEIAAALKLVSGGLILSSSKKAELTTQATKTEDDCGKYRLVSRDKLATSGSERNNRSG